MHLHLGGLDWLGAELGAAASAGLRLAMIAPALVDGVPLSHPRSTERGRCSPSTA